VLSHAKKRILRHMIVLLLGKEEYPLLHLTRPFSPSQTAGGDE
jgi:hypothetical protein